MESFLPGLLSWMWWRNISKEAEDIMEMQPSHDFIPPVHIFMRMRNTHAAARVVSNGSKTEIYCQRGGFGFLFLVAIFSFQFIGHSLGFEIRKPWPSKPDAGWHSVIYDEEKGPKANRRSDIDAHTEGDEVYAPVLFINRCRFKYQLMSIEFHFSRLSNGLEMIMSMGKYVAFHNLPKPRFRWIWRAFWICDQWPKAK